MFLALPNWQFQFSPYIDLVYTQKLSYSWSQWFMRPAGCENWEQTKKSVFSPLLPPSRQPIYKAHTLSITTCQSNSPLVSEIFFQNESKARTPSPASTFLVAPSLPVHPIYPKNTSFSHSHWLYKAIFLSSCENSASTLEIPVTGLVDLLHFGLLQFVTGVKLHAGSFGPESDRGGARRFPHAKSSEQVRTSSPLWRHSCKSIYFNANPSFSRLRITGKAHAGGI